jgi:ubiquinone/menaquinone biosynthesis C-methylase UbiE
MLDRPDYSSVHQHNRRAWDRRAEQQERFTRPADDQLVDHAWAEIDTAWLGDVRGKRLLCLASGGGRQSALYAAAGAHVTVVDISGEMLALDRQVAEERSLDIRVVETSMDDLSMFAAGSFELVVHPVSTCYVPDVLPVYREVARVTQPGGIYVSQHKQPVNLQASTKPEGETYRLLETYDRRDPLPPVAGTLHREEGTLEFVHTWEALLGGLCRAGFVIEDVREPQHGKLDAAVGSFAHRSCWIPPYVRIKARRVGASAASTTGIWVPK